MSLLRWLFRPKPKLDVIQAQDRRDLQDLRQEFQRKVRRSEVLRQEIMRLEQPRTLRRTH